ncbi:hypothetical protein ACHQM5_009234 [Ranunculus cassubicifolius]
MEFSTKKRTRFHLPTPSPSKKQKTLSNSITITQSTTKTSTHTHIHSHTPSIPSRQWNFSNHNRSNLKDEIVVVSYNILGVANAENHWYLYKDISSRYLNWERRKRCIHREVKCYNASVLCLQEVDRYSDLVEMLKPDGYRGIYKARTGDTRDGCAIFWRDDMFTLLHVESIEFRDFDLRDNVAQFCVLKIRLFVKKAQLLSKEWGNIPVVIAGDLNSTPQSGIYNFVASSELDLLRHDSRELSGQIELPSRWRPFSAHNEVSNRWSKEQIQLVAGSEGKTHLRHYLDLRSAYAGVPGSSSTRDNGGEPLVTTCHSNFMGTVDYIWHSKDLVPVGVLETLPVRKMRGLPSEEWGSDHFALVCKLAFADVQSEDADDTG